MWGLFMGFFKTASKTLSSASNIISQVNFPHEAVLVKQAAMNISNFAATFVLNIVVMLAFGVVPSPWTVLFPLVILPLFFLGAALGLIVAVISEVSFDASKIIDALLRLLMFATPVIYANKLKAAWLQGIIAWNPLTYLVCSARDIMIYGRLYDATGYFLCAGLSFLLFSAALRLFYVAEDRVVERML
jgi:ABC-type polysaccharide/polyol phosphate export permease